MPESISAFIVERAFSGVTSGRKEDKMGIRASATTTVTFNDVALPKEALLATEGSGFKIAMAILNSGRSGLGGGCVGGMKQAIRNATTHAESRKQFDKTLIEFPLIQEKLAEMKLRMFATESLTMLVGELITTASSDYAIEAAALKIYSTENLWYVANEALQIAGGVGYMREYPYERLVRDSRINLIFEGTNEVLRLFIALSGLKGVGEYLQTLQTGISNFWQTPIDSFEILWDYVEHRFGVNSGSNTESLLTLTKGAYREEIRILRRVINLFAVSCENFTRRYRKEVVEKQLELTALANVAIELLASLAVLRRVAQDESIERSLGRAILRAHIHTAKRVCKHNLRKLEVNEWQERKVVSRLLRV
jgi:acyl-CoA dehydrogenase family protein 9